MGPAPKSWRGAPTYLAGDGPAHLPRTPGSDGGLARRPSGLGMPGRASTLYVGISETGKGLTLGSRRPPKTHQIQRFWSGSARRNHIFCVIRTSNLLQNKRCNPKTRNQENRATFGPICACSRSARDFFSFLTLNKRWEGAVLTFKQTLWILVF